MTNAISETQQNNNCFYIRFNLDENIKKIGEYNIEESICV